jgi:hypothetical protein
MVYLSLCFVLSDVSHTLARFIIFYENQKVIKIRKMSKKIIIEKNNNDNNNNELIDKLNNTFFSYIDEKIDDDLNCRICFNPLLHPMILECCDNTFL